ncbi:MAG: serine hydrolase [Candidatus Nealsonbacteria bacterium DGGOD1a]|jgi:D-alanyl-D-alanine carboxypeptidase|nr:MAG: serine hydrolase [Candidatus Nealsonbacteria bacterium DGGOD1a]
MKSKMIKPSPAPLPELKLRNRKDNRGSVSEVAERLLIFIVAGLAGGLACAAINDGQSSLENYLYAQASAPIGQMDFFMPEKKAAPNLYLDAKASVSLRIGATGREKTIFKKNADEVLPIASLTKLMTAAVVFENPNPYVLDRQIMVSEAAAAQNDVPVFGNLQARETYTVRRLLNLMLFYSSNDAAYALSEVMGNDEFIAAMNKKAQSLGLEDTVFYNSNGLDMDDGNTNHSSAADLIILVKYILENHREIFYFTIRSDMYLTENGIFNIKLWDGQSLIGGKTGYTEKAGGCMVLIVENQKNQRYINILLGSTSPETRVAEMQKLINFANNNDN